MDGVVKMYESKLKQLNPNMKNITYDIQELYNYIDSLTDLSALVYVLRIFLFDWHGVVLTLLLCLCTVWIWRPRHTCPAARSGSRRRSSRC